MQPRVACVAVLLWLLRHAAAVSRSRSSPVHAETGSASSSRVAEDDHVQQLRGPAALRVQRDNAVLVSGSVLDSRSKATEAFLGKPKESKATKGKGAKKGEKQRPARKHDEDETLTRELVDQATTQPAKKRFDRVDRNGDGKIDEMEYFASTRACRRVATNRFNCTDENMDHSLSLKEFSDAQDQPDHLEQCITMMFAFKMVDKNRDGGISQEELWSNVGGPNFDSRWAFTIACSDRNNDGRVSPLEFSKDMYGCMEEKSDVAMTKFRNYSRTDRDGDGCANQSELALAVNTLFGIDLISDKPPSRATRKLTRRWMSCTDFNSDRCLNRKEYDDLMNPTPAQSHCTGTAYEKYEGDMDFEIMDTSDDDKVSRQEYYNWIEKLDLEVDQQDADALFTNADVNKNGFIDEHEFVHAGEEHEGDGPGYLFLTNPADPTRSIKSRIWRGSIQKTFSGLYRS